MKARRLLSRKFFDFENWTGIDVMVKIGIPVLILIIMAFIYTLNYCFLSEPIPQ